MSRTKKSRKPGRIKPSSAPASIVGEREPRARKKSGNKAGTRQTVANVERNPKQETVDKDPRIGSKKPIDLGISLKPQVKKPKAKSEQSAPIAAIRVAEETTQVDQTELLEQELLAIESNQELQILAAKVDAGEDVSEQEAELLATSLERYQQIIDQLDLAGSDETEQEAIENSASDDEDDLLDKLDDLDLSEFK
ncbi:GTPase-activating protein [Thalassotalea crassostreae]|uniref:GTPase-activating protein n=1 Tax=Thalassotalea crassostreae TaxID=1763536 RepID=UPI0008385EA2|nr:GTPase-activating protein [Thalassotalea crassostreae]